MLTSLVLQLQSPAAARLPASLGRAGQALLLRLVQAQNPTLAEELHQSNGLKPYTASNLVLGKRQGGTLTVEAGQSGWLRFTGLTEPVSGVLQGLAAQPPAAVELDGCGFTVTGATLNPADHPWAGQTSYQDLAAPYLLGGQCQPAARIEFDFASPTTFKSQGVNLPLPMPELVFGSLLDRWQTFAPIALHPETRRFAREAVTLSRYNIRTRPAPGKQGGLRIGFTGAVTFAALNKDRYWLNIVHLLAAFAFYSGVGARATTGLGQCRMTNNEC
jgi:CRISPR-associated endoribonuclease Cas6